MSAREVVEQYLTEVLNGRRPEAINELISSDEFRQRVTAFRNAFPDLDVETMMLISEGDLVAGHFVGRGTHQGLFQGMPATGKSWEARCTAIYRVAEGRIAEAWVNWDLLALLEQIGAVERAKSASA